MNFFLDKIHKNTQSSIKHTKGFIMPNRVNITLSDEVLELEGELEELADKKNTPEPSRSNAINVVYRQYLRIRIKTLRKNES